jgi:uncharacterized protein YutE (UPF0331/DUF86 family)
MTPWRRNVLVHEYVKVDYAMVAKAAERALEDYRRYVQEVARFLASSTA